MRDARSSPVPLFLAIVFSSLASGGLAQEPKDRLAAEIERWTVFARDMPATDEESAQVKKVTEPVLARAAEALRDGRRFLAFQRLASARVYLAASAYVRERPADRRKEMAFFEEEWKRMGKVLQEDLGAPSPAALDGVKPAAIRAIGETALPQVRSYYDASLEYGRNTMAETGLFYVGSAQAQRELVALSRALSTPSARRAPPLRALDAELDALEGELLSAYRPPASIDKHGDFIAASSALKEARELNGARLRYGALLRYLQASLRLAPLRAAAPTPDAGALAERLRELETRLSASELDQSLGLLFLETARAEAAAGPSPTAVAIVEDVLPRYLAALEPARAVVPRPPPTVTVTLVRWPYT